MFGYVTPLKGELKVKDMNFLEHITVVFVTA